MCNKWAKKGQLSKKLTETGTNVQTIVKKKAKMSNQESRKGQNVHNVVHKKAKIAKKFSETGKNDPEEVQKKGKMFLNNVQNGWKCLKRQQCPNHSPNQRKLFKK